MTTDETWSAAFTGASTSGLRTYEDVLVPRLFAPWAALLLDRLAVRPGEALLDVATGPGTVATAAAVRVGPEGRVTGADLSPAMLALAWEKPPIDGAATVEYVQCPADALPVADDSYDVVTCQQGLQFFPDRPAALREFRRAARPGGRIGIAVWREVAESPIFAALADGLEHVAGAEAAATYRGGPWGFGDPGALESLVTEAGFADAVVETHRLEMELVDVGQALAVLAFAVADIVDLDDDRRAALVDRVAASLGPLTTAEGTVRSWAAANIVVATAP